MPGNSQAGPVRSVALVAAAGYAAFAMRVAAGVIIARALGPAARGELAAISLLCSLAFFVTAGPSHGLSNELPRALAENDGRRARDAMGASLVFVLGAAVPIAGVLALMAWGWPETLNWTHAALAAGIIAGHGVVTHIFMVQRGRQEFSAYSAAAALWTLCDRTLGAAGALASGVTGSLAGMAVAPLAVVVACGRGSLGGFAPVTHMRTALRALARAGWPLLLTGQAQALAALADRVVIAVFCPTAFLGLYAAVALFPEVAAFAGLSIFQVLQPKASAAASRAGAGAGPPLKMLWVTGGALALILAGVLAGMPAAVTWLLPAYTAAIPCGAVLVAATAPLTAIRLWPALEASRTGNLGGFARQLAGAGLVQLGAGGAVAWSGAPLEAIAAVQFAVLLALAWRLHAPWGRAGARALVALLAPGALLCPAAYALGNYFVAKV